MRLSCWNSQKIPYPFHVKKCDNPNNARDLPNSPTPKQTHTQYQYDPNGNLISVDTSLAEENPTQAKPKANSSKMLWDEENRLLGTSTNGYVSLYWYDATGERTIKESARGEEMFVNAKEAGGYTNNSHFTAYVNPYLVVEDGGKYTKHIYMGSQRIVSKLGDYYSYGADPRRIVYAGHDAEGISIDYAMKYQAQTHQIPMRYDSLKVPYYGKENNDYQGGQSYCCTNGNRLTSKFRAEDYEKMQYYYHADHLGSSNYITNLAGEVVQHVEYIPFGEVFVEERNSTWNTPFLFNGKELDNETGWYYYGARYYNPKTSLWLSVDPLAEKYPGVSSYTYCMNNPVNLVDPDGQFPILINGRVGKDSERGSWTYWDKSVRETIKSRTGYYHSQFKYVDGDKGMWAGTRRKAGLTQGTSDAASVYAKMKESMVDGKITKQLQVISHSRGGAFANGYMQGLTAEVKKLAAADEIEFAYGADNIVQYSVNLAPHQSNSINYPTTGATNVNISHYGDPLSGNDATGDVINVHSNTDLPGPDQHGNATYNKELDFTLQILEGGQSNVKGQLQEKYKKWDKTRNRGLESTVE